MNKTFLFNPYTGTPRHPSDIASDPAGLLILDDGEPLRAAQAPQHAGQRADAQPVDKLDAAQWKESCASGFNPFCRADRDLRNHPEPLNQDSLIMKPNLAPRTLADASFQVGYPEAEHHHRLVKRSGAAADFVILLFAAFVAGAGTALYLIKFVAL